MERQFHGKIIIDLPFKLLTGTHIGNENDGFAIGGVNKVVVRDAVDPSADHSGQQSQGQACVPSWKQWKAWTKSSRWSRANGTTGATVGYSVMRRRPAR